jgi:hypothetical protein
MKNVADRVDITESYSLDVDGFLTASSAAEPAEAVFETGYGDTDDTDDTASSVPMNVAHGSRDVAEFLIAAAVDVPAEAAIVTGGGDIEDTASSAPPKKKNIFRRAYKAIKNWINEHNRVLINPSSKMPPLAF